MVNWQKGVKCWAPDGSNEVRFKGPGVDFTDCAAKCTEDDKCTHFTHQSDDHCGGGDSEDPERPPTGSVLKRSGQDPAHKKGVQRILRKKGAQRIPEVLSPEQIRVVGGREG